MYVGVPVMTGGESRLWARDDSNGDDVCYGTRRSGLEVLHAYATPEIGAFFTSLRSARSLASLVRIDIFATVPHSLHPTRHGLLPVQITLRCVALTVSPSISGISYYYNKVRHIALCQRCSTGTRTTA
jgi:hypothetical protein